jgi:NADH dehydrogenase
VSEKELESEVAAKAVSQPALEPRKIAVVGEIPFSGSALARALQKKGLSARVLCPDPQAEAATLAARDASISGAGVEIVRGDVGSEQALREVFTGAYGAIFLSPVTLAGRVCRAASHIEDVRRVVEAAEQASIRKLVYHSMLGASPESPSQTTRQAAEAEALVRAARCEDFTIQTGPLMGRGDGFLTHILQSIRSSSPIMTLRGYGSTRVQPLHVDDMARCCARFFVSPKEDLQPGVYRLGGPETLTLLDLVDAALARTGRAKLKIHLPLFILKMISSARANTRFAEEVALLFDVFFTEQNDAEKLLGADVRMMTAQEAQDEILTGAAV